MPTRSDVRVIAVPANDMAAELGSDRVANMCALGAYLAATRVVSMDSIAESLKEVLPARRHNLIPLNIKALEAGAELAR